MRAPAYAERFGLRGLSNQLLQPHDLEFADQLDTALRYCGFASTIDRHGEDWQRRLGNLIRDADTVAFVLSPASAKSEICAWEVGEAVGLGKSRRQTS